MTSPDIETSQLVADIVEAARSITAATGALPSVLIGFHPQEHSRRRAYAAVRVHPAAPLLVRTGSAPGVALAALRAAVQTAARSHQMRGTPLESSPTRVAVLASVTAGESPPTMLESTG